MTQALMTLVLEDSDADTFDVSVFVSVGAGDTTSDIAEDYAHVFWDAVRPLVNGLLRNVVISFRPDFSAWDNNTVVAISDVQEKAIFSLKVCGQNRPVKLTLPTVKESIFENAGMGKFVDFTNMDVGQFQHVLENSVTDGGIAATDSHGNDICGILFGEQSFG